jgi:predicted ATPase
VPLRIARELGAQVGPRSDGWDEAVAALQGRQELLILDNAEHLRTLPALLERLLAALPKLRLLVTSRRRLGMADEWVLPLAPLDAAAACRLFLAAARLAPMRQPVAVSDRQLAELVELLGRLPLALRLAAAWTRHLPLPTLLAQLKESLALLQAGEDIDEHPAHRSLAATFERSWALLQAPLQLAFAALCAGSGSMRLDVAQALAGADAAQIAALADASLVELDVGGRVALHPLLRRFGRGKLEVAAEQAALGRHAQAIAALLRPFEDWDNADKAQALALMAPERQQIELAWETAIAQRRADWLQAMTGPTGGLAYSQGGIPSVLPLFQRAQAMLEGLTVAPAATQCDLTLEHAGLHFWCGDQDRAERHARQGLALARTARLHRPMSQSLNLLALVALRRGQTGRAATLMTRALAQARRAGHRHDVAAFSSNLSGVQRELGQLDLARASALEALDAFRSVGDATGETGSLAELSQLAYVDDRLDEAAEWIRQALAVSEHHGMTLRRVSLLLYLGWVRFDQGRTDEAASLAAQAQAEMRARGGRHYHEPTLHRLLAELAVARGDPVGAREALRAACACIDPMAQDVHARSLLWSLATLAESAGDRALAAALGGRAEQGRPPRALPLPRYRRLRERLPAAPEPLPDDAELRRAIERLLA